MKNKLKTTGGTIRKLHRLARELEALNDVQVKFYVMRDCLDSRRKRILFEAVPSGKETAWWEFGGIGGVTIREALADFYETWAFVKRRGEEAKFLPGRFPLAEAAYALPGIHGKKVVLSKAPERSE